MLLMMYNGNNKFSNIDLKSREHIRKGEKGYEKNK